MQRYFALFGLQPHRRRGFKLSKDPFFVEKVIVGLYLNPPDTALVLSVDEKTQVQALERSQPVLPMGLGYVEGRHTRLLPPWHHNALCRLGRGQRNGDRLMQAAASASGVPVVPAPCGAQRSGRPRRAPHPRQLRHAYASWLSQVERWFGLITQQTIRRASFKTVKDLVNHIDRYIAYYNQHSRPFTWTATADSILAKVERLSKLICGTGH